MSPLTHHRHQAQYPVAGVRLAAPRRLGHLRAQPALECGGSTPPWHPINPDCGGLTAPWHPINSKGGGLTPTWEALNGEGGVKPPHSKALRTDTPDRAYLIESKQHKRNKKRISFVLSGIGEIRANEIFRDRSFICLGINRGGREKFVPFLTPELGGKGVSRKDAMGAKGTKGPLATSYFVSPIATRRFHETILLNGAVNFAEQSEGVVENKGSASKNKAKTKRNSYVANENGRQMRGPKPRYRSVLLSVAYGYFEAILREVCWRVASLDCQLLVTCLFSVKPSWFSPTRVFVKWPVKKSERQKRFLAKTQSSQRKQSFLLYDSPRLCAFARNFLSFHTR